MQKKLTISVDQKVYEGLHAVIGRGNISRFLERLARPYLFPEVLEAAYRDMAADELRECEAEEWAEITVQDAVDETR